MACLGAGEAHRSRSSPSYRDWWVTNAPHALAQVHSLNHVDCLISFNSQRAHSYERSARTSIFQKGKPTLDYSRPRAGKWGRQDSYQPLDFRLPAPSSKLTISTEALEAPGKEEMEEKDSEEHPKTIFLDRSLVYFGFA